MSVVIGLSAIFLLWVGAIFLFSTQLVWRHWQLYFDWMRQDRETKLRMSIWLAIPMMMAGLFWMRGTAVYNYLTVPGCCSTFTVVQMLIYTPLILAAFALILWYVSNRVFIKPDVADNAWYWFVISGIMLGVLTSLYSFNNH